MGLGHVSRDLAIVRAMRRLDPRTSVVWITASPARELLELEGENIHEVSRELESITPFIERFVDEGFSIALAKELAATLRRNFEKLVESVDLKSFDAVFADEFWELVLCGSELRRYIVFGTDFVFLPIRVGIASMIFNRAFIKRLKQFRKVMLLNLLEDVVRGIGALVAGVLNPSKWVKQNCSVVGLATSYLCEELPQRERARRELGICEGEKLVVVSLGGSRARYAQFLDKVSKALQIVAKRIKGVHAVFVLGPRAKPLSDLCGEVLELASLETMRTLYVAADLFIARSGRTTTADLECCGTPAVLVPIANHAEQIHIARTVAKRRSDLFTYIDEGCSVEELARVIESRLSSSPPARRCPEHCRGVYRAAEQVLEIARQGLI